MSPPNGVLRGRSGPKEEGGVRLSAGVRIHCTASHERSPLRGRGAGPDALHGANSKGIGCGSRMPGSYGIGPLEAGYSWRSASMGSRREALRAG